MVSQPHFGTSHLNFSLCLHELSNTPLNSARQIGHEAQKNLIGNSTDLEARLLQCVPDDLDSPLLVRVGGLQAVKGGQAAEEGGAAAGNDACEKKIHHSQYDFPNGRNASKCLKSKLSKV